MVYWEILKTVRCRGPREQQVQIGIVVARTLPDEGPGEGPIYKAQYSTRGADGAWHALNPPFPWAADRTVERALNSALGWVAEARKLAGENPGDDE